MLRKSWWLALALGLSGCTMSGGFNRNLLESRLQDGCAKTTEDEIKHIQTLKAQLNFPCRIAVPSRAATAPGAGHPRTGSAWKRGRMRSARTAAPPM